jgi:hypothetical protein
MEATDYKVKIQAAESYYISTEKYSWAYFYITPTGELFVHSDWGYYCFSWKAFGEDFKQFLLTLGAEIILLGKLETNYREMKGARAKFGDKTKEALTYLFSCLQTELKKERRNESLQWVTMDAVEIKAIDASGMAEERRHNYNSESADIEESCESDDVWPLDMDLYPEDRELKNIKPDIKTMPLKFRFIIPFYDAAGGAEAMLGWLQVWAIDAVNEPMVECTLYSAGNHRDLISAVRFDDWAYQVVVDDNFGGNLNFREIVRLAYNKYLKQKNQQ